MKYIPESAARRVRQHLWERDVHRSNLERITKVEARLHKISFSTEKYGYQDLIKLGDFKDATDFGWQNPSYDKKYIRHFKDFFLNAFINPKKRYYPRMMIYIYPRKDLSPEKYKKFLNQLYSYLPRLNVSKVEYAIDLFCDIPDDARSLFEVIIKFLYISNQQSIKMYDNNRENFHLNRLYRIGKAYKIYERGKDIHKLKKNGWNVSDLDRVRFEFTANCEILKKHGINTLKDLIDDPKFIYLNWEMYLFRHFNYARRLHDHVEPYGRRFPAPYERYLLEHKSGVSGTFHSEYFAAKNILKNFSPYIIKQPYFFKKLESILYEAMGKFGKEWRGA